MVIEKNKNTLIIPIILSVILSLIYFVFGGKYFLAALTLSFGAFLSLIDFKIALFGVTFIMPFLPNTLGLLAYLGLGFLYFLRRIFVEKSDGLVNNIFSGIIGLYFIVIVIQTITSIDTMGSIRDLALHLAGLLYVFAAVNTIKTKKDLNRLVTVLMATVTIIALIGLVQAVIGVEIQREWLDVENNPDTKVRVFSVFANPNTLAEYLVIFMPLSICMFWHTKSLKKKTVFGLAVGAMLLCIVLTMSRGGWIGLAMAALVFCVLVDKRLLLLTIPIIFIGLIFLPSSVINRILSIGNLHDTSNAHRIDIWRISLALIKDNLIAGVGFGYTPFKLAYETYSRTINAYHAHNSFLETVGEIGLVGFGVFMAMLYTFIKEPINQLIKPVKSLNSDKYFLYIAVGVVAGIMGVFTHGLVENILYLPRIIFSFWTLVGIGIIAVNVYKLERLKLVKSDNGPNELTRSCEIDA